MRIQVGSLALLSGLRIGIAVSCHVGCRHGSDLMLLWLLCRLAATALIRPLVWGPPYAMSAAFQRKAKKLTSTNEPWNGIQHYL